MPLEILILQICQSILSSTLTWFGLVSNQFIRCELSGHTVRVVRRHGPSGPGSSGLLVEMSGFLHINLELYRKKSMWFRARFDFSRAHTVKEFYIVQYMSHVTIGLNHKIAELNTTVCYRSSGATSLFGPYDYVASKQTWKNPIRIRMWIIWKGHNNSIN